MQVMQGWPKYDPPRIPPDPKFSDPHLTQISICVIWVGPNMTQTQIQPIPKYSGWVRVRVCVLGHYARSSGNSKSWGRSRLQWSWKAHERRAVGGSQCGGPGWMFACITRQQVKLAISLRGLNDKTTWSGAGSEPNEGRWRDVTPSPQEKKLFTFFCHTNF